MDRKLHQISPDELNAIAIICDDGSLTICTAELGRAIARAAGCDGVRVAVTSADYCQRDDGTPEPATRSITGIWWLPYGDDTALIGSFTVDGTAMSLVTEGKSQSPVAEDLVLLERATTAIVNEYAEPEVLEPGKAQVLLASGRKLVRVVVTRDYRVRRPQDLLDSDDLASFDMDGLALAIVQLVSGGKALVIKHGL